MHPGSQQWIIRLLSIVIMERAETDGKNWLCDKTQKVGRSEEKSDGW
jgi:hypothetical protein